MERLERFYKIDQLLKERKVVSFAAFMEALGMSRASVKRDLDYMRERFNAPIEYDREANGYRLGKPRTGPRYELPGFGSPPTRRMRS
jgi:predicted DNA-binding transcriptional regulator YafY